MAQIEESDRIDCKVNWFCLKDDIPLLAVVRALHNAEDGKTIGETIEYAICGICKYLGRKCSDCWISDFTEKRELFDSARKPYPEGAKMMIREKLKSFEDVKK